MQQKNKVDIERFEQKNKLDIERFEGLQKDIVNIWADINAKRESDLSKIVKKLAYKVKGMFQFK